MYINLNSGECKELFIKNIPDFIDESGKYPAFKIEVMKVGAIEMDTEIDILSLSEVAKNQLLKVVESNPNMSIIVSKVMDGNKNKFKFDCGTHSSNFSKSYIQKFETPVKSQINTVLDPVENVDNKFEFIENIDISDIDKVIELLLLKKYGINTNKDIVSEDTSNYEKPDLYDVEDNILPF